MADDKYVKTKSFQGALQKAKSILGDKERMGKVLQRTQEKMTNMPGVKKEMNSFLDKVRTFIRMIKAYISGSYKDIPVRSILLMIAGLVYFITPLDFLPDFIPGIGMIDDVGVVLAVFNSVADDVSKFRLYEQERELEK